MSFYLDSKIDFTAHNEEVKRVWDAHQKCEPYRAPVQFSGAITNLFNNPEINNCGWNFQEYFENPQAQIDAQLAFSYYRRFHWLSDSEMGLPQAWELYVDFLNSYELGWYGCQLKYDGPMPDAHGLFENENKMKLYEAAPPDALRGGIFARAHEFIEYQEDMCRSLEFKGRPVRPSRYLPGEGTDGPFTIACKLRGLTQTCFDMIDDEKYFHDLMTFVTENTIRRIKALREWRWQKFPETKPKSTDPHRPGGLGFADDAVAMLSVDHYCQFVLPYHKRLAAELSDGSRGSIHLCGNATHLFKTIRDELNIWSFDTGFPVDFKWLRETLGPEAHISGGPTIMLLKSGTPTEVRAEVKRICESGILVPGKFVLHEANNLAPCTPVENLTTFYEAGREFGCYQ